MQKAALTTVFGQGRINVEGLGFRLESGRAHFLPERAL